MDAQAICANVAELAKQFQENQRERQQRSALVQADFDGLKSAGFHLLSVPVENGGAWAGAPKTTRAITDVLRTLARIDSSLALVSAMHPLVVGFWLNIVVAPPPYEDAWRVQREEVFQSVKDGAMWGTITSESGSGGDIFKTSSVAHKTSEQGKYQLTGQKQFGSGSGILSNMITTAIPDGEEVADWFFMNMEDVGQNNLKGLKITAPWDGQGMRATQSHAISFESYPATRFAIHGHPLDLLTGGGRGTGQCFFASVIVGIVETALESARNQITARKDSLHPFESMEWLHIEKEGWLIQQAFEGMLRAAEQKESPRQDLIQGKVAIAELAESVMTRMCRVLGGGTFSRYSPYGFWFEDVRALGFLRPSWALAYQNLLNMV